MCMIFHFEVADWYHKHPRMPLVPAGVFHSFLFHLTISNSLPVLQSSSADERIPDRLPEPWFLL